MPSLSYSPRWLLQRIVDTEEFKNIDPELAPSIEEIRQGIREGFLSLDEEMRKLPQIVKGLDRSGSTAVCVLVTPKHLFFVNCGDSRAVLIRDGAVGFATTDHKPAHPSERKRIQKAGGSVIVDRVNGNLAVSRYVFFFLINFRSRFLNLKLLGACNVGLITTHFKTLHHSRYFVALLPCSCCLLYYHVFNSIL